MIQGFERYEDGVRRDSRVGWLLLSCINALQWDNEKWGPLTNKCIQAHLGDIVGSVPDLCHRKHSHNVSWNLFGGGGSCLQRVKNATSEKRHKAKLNKTRNACTKSESQRDALVAYYEALISCSATVNGWRADSELDRVLEAPELFRCPAKAALVWALTGKTWDLGPWDGDIWRDASSGFWLCRPSWMLKVTEIVHTSTISVCNPSVWYMEIQRLATSVKFVHTLWSGTWWNMPSNEKVKLLHPASPTQGRKRCCW